MLVLRIEINQAREAATVLDVRLMLETSCSDFEKLDQETGILYIVLFPSFSRELHILQSTALFTTSGGDTPSTVSRLHVSFSIHACSPSCGNSSEEFLQLILKILLTTSFLFQAIPDSTAGLGDTESTSE